MLCICVNRNKSECMTLWDFDSNDVKLALQEGAKTSFTLDLPF